MVYRTAWFVGLTAPEGTVKFTGGWTYRNRPPEPAGHLADPQ